MDKQRGILCVAILATPTVRSAATLRLDRRTFVLVLLLLAAPLRSYGQPGVLDLSEALHLALAHQPQTAAVRDDIDAARRLVDARKGAFLPHFDVEANQAYNSSDNGIPDFATANGRRETVAQIILSQKIYDPAAAARIAAASVETAVAGYQALNTRLTIAQSVVRVYYVLQAQHAAIEIWRRAVEQAKTILAATQKGMRNGIRSRLDLLRAESTLNSVQGGLSKAEAAEAGAARTLCLMTGLRNLPPLRALPAVASNLSLPSRQRLQAVADQHQPTLGVARSRKDRNGALLDVARSRRLPRIQAEMAYGLDTVPSLTKPGWRAGVRLTVPLFEGGTARAQEDAARSRFQAAQQRYRQARLDVQTSLSTALGNAQQALAAYRTANEVVQTKERIWRISNEGYRAGRLSSLELSLAQQDLLRAQLQQLAAAEQLRLGLARITLATGRLPKDYGP